MLDRKGNHNVRYHLYIVAGALAIASTGSARAGEMWPAAEMRQNLFGSCFVSDKEGWMVGDLARIFHTVDGGQTWEQLDAGTKRPFVSIACRGNNMWVAGQVGQIGHSTDGGRTWQMQQSGTQRLLLDIAFANTLRGLAVGDYGTLLRTDDGGATWTKIPLPQDLRLPADVMEVVDPGDVLLYSATFADPDHAWIAGEFGVILASTDGGQTWQQQASSLESTLFGVSFSDPLHGWAVGLDAVLLHTADGGMTWQRQDVETPKGFFPALYGVQVSGNYGWAVGNNGFLLSSTDAGATWQKVKVPIQMGSGWFRDVSLLPDGRGFIIGASGLVLAADRNTFTPLKQRF
jgi:photosystem II stability/assembly factor-like uncharacterized protein